MKCHEVMELLEEYIMGDLEIEKRDAVEAHLQACPMCKSEYEETTETIGTLKNLRASLKVKEDILTMNKRNIAGKVNTERRSGFRFIPVAAACFFMAVSLVTSSIVAFPTLAANYVPNLPVVKQVSQAREQAQEMEKEIEQVKLENERLKIEMKKIQDTMVKEVTTSEGVPEETNLAIQELVLDFIKAQYRNDIEAIKSLSTDKLKARIEENFANVLEYKKGEVVFTQITNVAKEGDIYLVFVGLNDSSSKDDADYYENFEVVEKNGKFLVDNVMKDA